MKTTYIIVTLIAISAAVAVTICALQERKERRFTIDFDPVSKSDEKGSVSCLGKELQSTERPGDKILVRMQTMFLVAVGTSPSQSYHTGHGSEIRFRGRFETGSGVVTGEERGRLVFRRVSAGWAYVSGRGQYEEQGIATKLGHDRTVASCLALLKSDDPILREGGARDLGRLCTPKDASVVVPQLVALLDDSSAPVRRGAIEGLGLIGTAEASTELQARYANETDPINKRYIEEALGFCAAYAILEEEGACVDPPEVGVERLLRGNDLPPGDTSVLNDWVADNLIRRVVARHTVALTALDNASSSSDPRIVEAVALIRKALQSSVREDTP